MFITNFITNFFSKKPKTQPQTTIQEFDYDKNVVKYTENLLVCINSVDVGAYKDCEASISIDIIKGKQIDKYYERIHCSKEQAKILIDYIEKKVWIQSELVADYENKAFQRKFVKII